MVECECRLIRRVVIRHYFREALVREFIARENIRRFEEQLAACADPKQRKILTNLLESERLRLSQALAEKPPNPQTS